MNTVYEAVAITLSKARMASAKKAASTLDRVFPGGWTPLTNGRVAVKAPAAPCAVSGVSASALCRISSEEMLRLQVPAEDWLARLHEQKPRRRGRPAATQATARKSFVKVYLTQAEFEAWDAAFAGRSMSEAAREIVNAAIGAMT